MGYLLFVVAVSVIGIVIVLRRTHRPTSTESGIDEFERAMRAFSRRNRS